MENSYKAAKSYQVFSIEDTHAQSHQRVYGLAMATHQSFETPDDAEEWIQVNGERHVQYSILEVFKKP